ncbi:hypothetical protein [Oenococcus oeni]|uniref:hypothetical protein n=1 Tax=Oenococcus oeni TaxID=1247 RepID=UPI0010B12BFD|nr:hypothetical protein [Oenococcus oeni]SYW20311.1 conserved hypothetical protein [Oenococcus oeni]
MSKKKISSNLLYPVFNFFVAMMFLAFFPAASIFSQYIFKTIFFLSAVINGTVIQIIIERTEKHDNLWFIWLIYFF